jgi:L-ascorbate metabolism protein UlaG (beta-lactamase superfamily)
MEAQVKKSLCNVIATGSRGNCVIYMKSIMVDLGVSFKAIKPFIKDIEIVLLTHIHKDHWNPSTIKKLQLERPSVRFACGDFVAKELELHGIRNVDVLKLGNPEPYYYTFFEVSPVKLYHNVKNYGWKIFKDGKKIIHITDTTTLDKIPAKNYDLYAIEHNYDEEKIKENILKARQKGDFSHAERAISTHLSWDQAQDFIFANTDKNHEYEVIRLHESSSNL